MAAADVETGMADSVHEVIELRSADGKLAAAERIHALTDGRVPRAPREQLRGAIEAVFRSWNSERAQVFRSREGIAADLGTAVTVQAMVFGNLDDRSGTGVVFTRCPVTGDRAPVGDYIARAQGEDVVAGTHAVWGLDALFNQLPQTHRELGEVLDRLEHHYRDLCDVEFTISAGKLYVLQTRIGRRSPLAAARVAVAMAEDPDFPLTKEEAVRRVDPAVLAKLATAAAIDPAATPAGRGLAASPGVGAGVLCCDPDQAAALSAKGVEVVLAREATSPSDIHGMVGAAALVTTTGGILSHAAVVARSWAIPAVTSLAAAEVGADGLRLGGHLITPGELITVDGASGLVYLGDCRAPGGHHIEEIQTLRRWAAELGIEFGEQLEEPSAAQPEQSSGRDVSLLEVVRTVQLKGLCAAERVASVLGAEVAAVDALIAANERLFNATPRGFMPTPAGRDWLTAALDAEKAAVVPGALDPCYERFVQLDGGFKKLVSEWQMLGAAGQSEAAQAEMVQGVAQLDEAFQPLIRDAAFVAGRLRSYAPRFSAALAQLQSGDLSMLASPMKDSYHTVWFELHEELIALSGRNRAEEERLHGG